ncbi:bacterio-opsin activator domain-containing protein [Halomarina litorea]|uniref:bacterio-opsin activator domain-containing protein n=1 Tax=Halomarina litorea TaxID=2961595 RepID=UPI0020C20452|nr:bacterio-opsin activator domain-containing protein [Halomarina sp. BCD28]
MTDLAAFLCAGGYDRLRRATGTHRSDLVVRLCGEAGLRPSEVVSVRPDDVVTDGDARFLRLDDREAFLPAGVAHDLRKFAESVGDGPLVDVSERRVQMLVREAGDRAADRTSDARFREVSTRDLRAAHARRLLHDGVPPQVVLRVTAYDRLAALNGHLPTPDRERVAAALTGGEATPDDPPARLRRTVSVAADVGEALAAATTAADIRETVCTRLAGTDGYRFAWVAEATGDGLVAAARAGVGGDAVERTLADPDDLVAAALDDREVRSGTTENGTLVAIPLVGGETTRGVLGIGVAPEAVEGAELDLLGALGAQVGHALAAVERKRRLLADTTTELTFAVGRETAPLPSLAAALECTAELVGVVPSEEGLLCYVAVGGVTPDAALDYLGGTDAVADARFVGDDESGVLLEVTLRNSPARTLADAEGRVRTYEADDRGGRLVGEVSTDVDVRRVVERVTDAFPEITLEAKRDVDRAGRTDTRVRETLTDELTERQAAALRSAYFGGYFEWPRDSTAEELADSLGVSSPTLHNHLRTAQQKLFRALLDDT